MVTWLAVFVWPCCRGAVAKGLLHRGPTSGAGNATGTW